MNAEEPDEDPAINEAAMLTISTRSATQLNERRKISGAILVDKVKLATSVRFDGLLELYSGFFCPLWTLWLSPRLRPPNTERILLLIWLLTSCFRSGDLRVTRMKVSARMEARPSEGRRVARCEDYPYTVRVSRNNNNTIELTISFPFFYIWREELFKFVDQKQKLFWSQQKTIWILNILSTT